MTVSARLDESPTQLGSRRVRFGRFGSAVSGAGSGSGMSSGWTAGVLRRARVGLRSATGIADGEVAASLASATDLAIRVRRGVTSIDAGAISGGATGAAGGTSALMPFGD